MLWMLVFFDMIISPVHPCSSIFLLLFLQKNVKGEDCWSIKMGIIHVKNKMHVASPTCLSASDVIAGDDSTNYVTY